MTQVNASELTAKLLATENLTVVRTPSKTASFDVVARVLNLPLWKDMSPEIESLFVQHEVGHALFTDHEAWVKVFDEIKDPKEQRIIKGYLNVVEDARIEKLMKRRYPGSRKSFFSGYKQLLERDFFGIKGKDVNAMMLIDRINLYFKGGISLGVSFSPEEKTLVNRVDRCETMDEMIIIAKDLYEFAKTELRERREAMQGVDSELSFEDEEDEELDEYQDFDSTDNDYSESESEEKEDETNEDSSFEENNTRGNAQGDVDEELESQTDKNLNEKLEELADTSIQYEYYEIEQKCWNDPIVPFKQVLKDTIEIDAKIAEAAVEYGYNHKAEFDKFMIESERMVSYLVKEFEMRKSAQAYRRAQTSKSGSLNMNKIHAYKLTDDIFKRITTIPDGKNHGMIFLLDWSGSMQNVIIPTIKQVINLAMFCRRINIPFEVYAFTGQYYGHHMTAEKIAMSTAFNAAKFNSKEKNIMFSDGFFSLLNLFSSKMTNNEFHTSARRFTSHFSHYIKGYAMGDTPLNEALVEMLNFIPDYKRRNNIEKLTFITLSDGAGGQLRTNNYITTWRYANADRIERIKIKNFISDKQTGKNYEIVDQAYSTTEALLKMIKDRYDVMSLGFYICENRRRVLQDVYRDHFGSFSNAFEIEQMRKSFREHGFYSMTGTGRDDLFVIPDSSTKIVDEELNVSSDLSASQIARKFAKTMNTKKHSRILLDRFIGYVA